MIAPAGRRDVATGGAARRRGRPTRNPWERESLILIPAPEQRWVFDANDGVNRPGTYAQILLHIVFSTKHRQGKRLQACLKGAYLLRILGQRI